MYNIPACLPIEATWIDWAAVTYGWVGYDTFHWPTLWLQVNWFLGHVQDL